MTSTGKKSRPGYSAAWKGQSVFKLDNIASNSGFKLRPVTSCTECKRLKIKCLKNESAQVVQSKSTSNLQAKTIFPCLTCIRRGCEAICSAERPLLHGANSTTLKGLESNATLLQHRQPVALHTQQTQILEYQNHITALKGRVRELENALQDAHAKLSDETHSMLRSNVDGDWSYEGDDENQGQFLNMRENQNSNDQLKEEDSVVEAFGSLSIREDGRSTYHAQNAGAWYYLQFNDEGTSPDVRSNAGHSSTNTTESQNGTPSSTAVDEAREPISLSAILTPDILYASRIFPMGAVDDASISSEIVMRIENYLPTREEALRLVDNYYANSSWLYDPISRSHFMSDIFDIVYPPERSRTHSHSPSDGSPDSSDNRHCTLLSYSLTLAMFFITLAIGTHLDLDQQCGSPSNNIYYHLARAAVASDRGNKNSIPGSVDETSTGTGMFACLLEPNLDVIRVLLLMCFYLHMGDGRTGYSASWALMGLVTKLANGDKLALILNARLDYVSVHLPPAFSAHSFITHPDRDPSKWSLDPVESRLRQEVFWELYTYDSWQSVPSGRPPSFPRMGIDLKRPYEQFLKHYSQSENRNHETDPSLDIDNDNVLNIFKAWKHHFCFMKLGPTVEQAWGARIPSYYTVLMLDRAIREDLDNTPVLLRLPPESGMLTAFKTPEMSAPCPVSLDPRTMTSLTMQRYTLLFMTHIALLLLHRPYFVQALNISDQPLTTKFAASVLAVYRSSCTLVIRGVELYALEPRLSPRLWYFWAQMFSGVTCLGGLVVRSPNLTLASSALAHIELACDLFERVKDSNRATRALPTMLKLRDRARLVLDGYQKQSTQRFQGRSGRTTLSNPVPMIGEEEKDEFSALVGQTRLVDLRTSSSGAKLISHSNRDLPPAELHPATVPQVPASQMNPPSGPGSAPLSTFNPTGSDADMSISTSTNSGHTLESDTEFGDQSMTSSEHIDQSQLIDSFLLFRQLGLDLTPSNINVGTGMDMEMYPYYADTNAPQIEPHWQLGYDPTKPHIPSGEAFLDTETSQGHQLDHITTMNMINVQPQDTDTAFENFIAQAMKGYTSRSDLNFNSSDFSPNLNLNLGANQAFTSSNSNLPHDPLGPSFRNPTFGNIEPGIHDQQFRNSGPGSTGGQQSFSTYPIQPFFNTNVLPEMEGFYGLNIGMMSMESFGDGVENDTSKYNVY